MRSTMGRDVRSKSNPDRGFFVNNCLVRFDVCVGFSNHVMDLGYVLLRLPHQSFTVSDGHNLRFRPKLGRATANIITMAIKAGPPIRADRPLREPRADRDGLGLIRSEPGKLNMIPPRTDCVQFFERRSARSYCWSGPGSAPGTRV